MTQDATIQELQGRISMPGQGSQAMVDGDGAVGMADLNLLVDYILGRITKFPVE